MMASAVCVLAIFGCSKSSDPYTPGQSDIDIYNMRFMSYVGWSINDNQDWGFDASNKTKSATRGEENGYFITDKYEKEYTKSYFTQALDSLPEGQKVAEKIRKNFEFISRGPFRFDIVFSSTKEEFEIGYYYYNPKTQTAADRKEVKFVSQFVTDLGKNNYFQYTTKSSPSISDWETPKASWGYTIWTTLEAKMLHAKMITLKTEDVPVGYRVGFYVKNPKDPGQTVYTNRFLNKDEQYFFAVLASKDGDLSHSYVVGMEDRASAEACDFDCNDVMLAVHKDLEDTFPLLVEPVKPTPVQTTWRVIAEDLSVQDNTDFDFNDIVLDVTLTNSGADCVLQAAGGTLPIRINGDNNLEVHKLFGVNQDVLVNTKAEKKGLKGATKDPVKFSITGSFSSVKDVKIEVNKGKPNEPKWIELYAGKGEPACKILVKNTFLWPDERESIKDVYPKFINWVKDPSVVWYP